MSSVFCMQVLFGLGNPGKEYEMTRHNLGFLVLEKFAKEIGISLHQEKRFNAKCARGRYKERTIDVCLPQTYMNKSGYAVSKYMNYFKYQPENMLVIIDDMALPFGTLRLKPSGGAGGHNGLRSIQKILKTTHYARMRMGIGKGRGESQVSHVLGRFTQPEQQQLPSLIQAAVTILKRLLEESFEKVASEVNRQNYAPDMARSKQNREEQEK